jgi:hypothetical protein
MLKEAIKDQSTKKKKTLILHSPIIITSPHIKLFEAPLIHWGPHSFYDLSPQVISVESRSCCCYVTDGVRFFVSSTEPHYYLFLQAFVDNIWDIYQR